MSAASTETVESPGRHRPSLAGGPPQHLDRLSSGGRFCTSAAFWLRFEGQDAAQFLPGLISSAPSRRRDADPRARGFREPTPGRVRDRWMLPIAAAVLIGTAIAVAGLGLASGFEGVSRGTFVVHASAAHDRCDWMAGRVAPLRAPTTR